MSTKEQDSKGTHSLMCILTLNRLRHFSVRILVPVTLKSSKKGFIKGETRGPKASQDKLSVEKKYLKR